jgi:hypothetical protein
MMRNRFRKPKRISPPLWEKLKRIYSNKEVVKAQPDVELFSKEAMDKLPSCVEGSTSVEGQTERTLDYQPYFDGKYGSDIPISSGNEVNEKLEETEIFIQQRRIE